MITVLSLLAFMFSQLPNIGSLDKPVLHSGSAETESDGTLKVTTNESIWTVRKLIIFLLLTLAVVMAFFGRSHHDK